MALRGPTSTRPGYDRGGDAGALDPPVAPRATPPPVVKKKKTTSTKNKTSK